MKPTLHINVDNKKSHFDLPENMVAKLVTSKYRIWKIFWWHYYYVYMSSDGP